MLLDLVKRARSYRRYDPTKPLSKDDLKAFVEAARLTPSAGNLQRLRYLAVTEKSEVLTLTKEVKWAGYLSDWDGPADSEAPAAYLILPSVRAWILREGPQPAFTERDRDPGWRMLAVFAVLCAAMILLGCVSGPVMNALEILTGGTGGAV